VHVQSTYAAIELFGFAVAILAAKCKLKKGSKTCTVIEPKEEKGSKGWLDRHGVKVIKGHVILFKRVSKEWKTQENTPNETVWTPGTTLEHKAWNPTGGECGHGKFHACATPYFCDEFRNEPGDRHIAIKVATKDLHAWDGGRYPHKIAFRAGEVMYECDRYGNKL